MQETQEDITILARKIPGGEMGNPPRPAWRTPGGIGMAAHAGITESDSTEGWASYANVSVTEMFSGSQVAQRQNFCCFVSALAILSNQRDKVLEGK